MAGLNTVAVLNQLESHASRLGMFDQVNTHEPKSAPSLGMVCAIWAGNIARAPGRSALDATTARVEWVMRLYTSMLAANPDAIDPNVMIATDALLLALHADYTLDDTVRNIDLLGEAGDPIRAEAGYLNIDGKVMRVMTIFVPVLINDAWSQHA